MDEEEKLRILVIIEKLLKERKIEPFRLEKVRDALNHDLKINDEDKKYVLDQWDYYQARKLIKKPKSGPLHPWIKILTIALIIVTIGIPVIYGLVASQVTDSDNLQPISREETKSDAYQSQPKTSKLMEEQAKKQNEGFVLSDKEEEALRLVQNYRGTDGSGSTVNEAIATIIVVSYAGEDIFNHPKTKYGWSAVKVYFEPGVYDVYFDWRSYDGEKTFHFIADFEQNKILPTDDLSSSILQIVDAEG